MITKYILIVHGEPFSIFSEIIGKYFSKIKKYKKKIIVIGNISLIQKQLNLLKFKLIFNLIENIDEAKINKINLINIDFKYKKAFDKITEKSNVYINECFKKSLEIINSNKNKVVLINGPVSKKTFLKKKYLGITEFLSKKTQTVNQVMLIYNKDFSVSPLTTHIPIKHVNKQISKEKIYNNVIKINEFFIKKIKLKPKIAILGLNPHCETIDKFSEEEKIIIPAINKLKREKIKVYGPFSADTFFIKNNISKFNVVIGMYHDQVLTAMKTIYNFNAINITIGLPFIRISPDHGPNWEMLGKNLSDPSSFFLAMNFAENSK